MRSAVILAIFFSITASAETLRLPCKYTITTFTVHNLTGLTSDEKEKDKVLPRPLDVLKATDKAGPAVKFVAGNRGGIDKSEPESVMIDTEEAQKIVAALTKFPVLLREAQGKRENAETELVNITDDLTLTLVATNAAKKVVLQFAFGESVFVLGKTEAEKLAAAIRKAM